MLRLQCHVHGRNHYRVAVIQKVNAPSLQQLSAHLHISVLFRYTGLGLRFKAVRTKDRAAASLTISALRRLDFGCRSHTHLRVSPHRRKVQASKPPRVLGVEALIVGKIEKVLDKFEAASLARLVKRGSPHLWRFHG